MKTIFKTLTASILAFVIAFGSFSAFAAEEKESIVYYYEEFAYAGNLTEGKNTVDLPSDYSIYCTFTAQTDGYYTLSYNWTEIEHFFIPVEDENGFTDETVKSVYIDTPEDNYSDTYLFYLEEGEYNFLSCQDYYYYENEAESATVEISYYGSKISDISFEGGTEYYLVPFWNIDDYYGDDDEDYPVNSYSFDSGETELLFDSGKKLLSEYMYLICSCGKEIENGEYTVTVYFMDETFEKTISVYPISKQITKVEIKNLEDYLDVSVAYDGEIIYDFTDMEITVTYADGFTKTLTFEEGEWLEVDLNNGNPYGFSVDYYYERSYVDDAIYFYVTIGGEEFIARECTVHEATGKENRQHLNYRIYSIISDMAWDIRYNFSSVAWANNLWEGIVYLRRALFDSADELFTAFEYIVEEIADCMKG